MNKKGFTLVELILVIVIIGIVTLITLPNIMEALEKSRSTNGKTIENLLLDNLELYNTDYKEDLWCLDNSINNCTEKDGNNDKKINISINDLYSMNNNIDLGECLLYDENSLVINLIETKDEEGKVKKRSYTYDVKIICSTDFDSNTNKIASVEQQNNGKIYYKSKDIQ